METVTVKCMDCGAKRKIVPGEIKKDDMPFCEKCFGIMLPESAEV